VSTNRFSRALGSSSNTRIERLLLLTGDLFHRHEIKRFAIALLVSILVHLLLTLCITIQPPHSYTASSSTVLEARIISSAPLSTDNRHDAVIGPDIIAANRTSSLKIAKHQSTSIDTTKKTTSHETLPNNRLKSTNRRPAIAKHNADAKPAITLPADQTYYPASQLDVWPQSLMPITPEFPQNIAANISGRVVLLVLIDASGNIDDVSVVEANPAGYFEESALVAIRNARFTPGQRFGESVKSRALIAVNFNARSNDEKSNNE